MYAQYCQSLRCWAHPQTISQVLLSPPPLAVHAAAASTLHSPHTLPADRLLLSSSVRCTPFAGSLPPAFQKAVLLQRPPEFLPATVLRSGYAQAPAGRPAQKSSPFSDYDSSARRSPPAPPAHPRFECSVGHCHRSSHRSDTSRRTERAAAQTPACYESTQGTLPEVHHFSSRLLSSSISAAFSISTRTFPFQRKESAVTNFALFGRTSS